MVYGQFAADILEDGRVAGRVGNREMHRARVAGEQGRRAKAERLHPQGIDRFGDGREIVEHVLRRRRRSVPTMMPPILRESGAWREPRSRSRSQKKPDRCRQHRSSGILAGVTALPRPFSVNNLDLQAHLWGVLMRKGFLTRLQTCGAAQKSPRKAMTSTGGRPCHHEIVTPLRARNAVNAAAIAASIAPAATMRAIVALKSAARALSTTLRIASKPCAATAASERLNLI